MFVPEEFSVNDPQAIDDFILAHPFISLVTTNTKFPIATHIPIVAKKINNIWNIEGHISLSNEQSHSIKNNLPALCIHLGANAYISSSVYGHENVPTWNYKAVHLSGRLVPLTKNEMENHLNELVELFEQNREDPLNYNNFSKSMIDSYKNEIIGFRLIVEKIEAAFKLSQNRNKRDHHAIIEDLEKCPFDGAKKIANAMKFK